MRIAVLILLLSFTVRAESAARFAALLSHDIEAYQLAWTEFRHQMVRRHPKALFTDFVIDSTGAVGITQRIKTQKINLLFAPGSEASLLARSFHTLPVISLTLTPAKFRDRNTIAISMDVPVDAKLARLRKLLPKVRRLGVIYSPRSAADYSSLKSACAVRGLEITGLKITDPKEFSGALSSITGRIDCFLMLTDPSIYFYQSTEHLLREALVQRFPVVGLSSLYTKAGATLSFECDYQELGRHACEAACHILEGQAPETIEPGQPRKMRVTVNLSVAERLGITFPAAALTQVDEVYGK